MYWTDGTGVNAATVNCSGDVRTLYRRVQAYENAVALALARDRVVWTDTVGGAVRVVSVGGGWPLTLASALGPAEPFVVAVGGDQAFWPHSRWGIQTAFVEGGDVATIAGGYVHAGGIAVDDVGIYWLDLLDDSVKRMPIAGGQTEVLASAQANAGYLAADGRSVYWTITEGRDTNQPTGYIVKVSRDGGTPVVLAGQRAWITGMVLDEDFVYWTEQTSGVANSGSVGRVRLDGSEAPVVLATGLDLPGDIAVDGRYVYWYDHRGIMRLAK